MRSALDTHIIHYAVIEFRIRSTTLLTSANHKKHQIIPPPDSQMRLALHYGLYIANAGYDCQNTLTHLSCPLGISNLKYDERRHLQNPFRTDYSSYANLLLFCFFFPFQYLNDPVIFSQIQAISMKSAAGSVASA